MQCYIRVDHLPPPWCWFMFHSILSFTALLDVLSEYNWSLFLRTAQVSLYEPLSVDVFSLFCFFLPLTIALSLFSIYSLSLHLGFNTPPPPPPLFSLSKDGEYGHGRNPPDFEQTSLPSFECFSFPGHAVLSLSVCELITNNATTLNLWFALGVKSDFD